MDITTATDARALIEAFGTSVALVVNHSGGKDSQRMLGHLKALFPDVRMYVVMADTGFEHGTAIEWTTQQAARFGETLHVARNPNKTYLQMVERRGMFPSATTRQCTSDLKRGPIQKFIRHLSEKIIINCTGIRAAESPARSKQTPWKLDDGLSKAGRVVYNWMPIFNESLQDVLQWHWDAGHALHTCLCTCLPRGRHPRADTCGGSPAACASSPLMRTSARFTSTTAQHSTRSQGLSSVCASR